MKDWLTVNELARIQGVTPRAIRKGVANNKYIVRQVNGMRGLKYEIFVPALNETTQNLIDFEKSKCEIEKNREPVLRKNSIIPPHARQIALARYDLVNLWVDYKKISKNKTQAGKEFIDIYNDGKIYSYLFNILGKISIGTIYRWHKAIKGNDDYTKLIPNYDYGEKESNPQLTHEEELVFKSLLLTPNKTNIGKAIGMSYADKKIKRYKHLYDRLSEILQFQKFSIEDIKNLINELSEIKFDNSAIEHIQNTENRFRQIVKIIDKAENYAKANDLSIITLKDMRFLLK